MRKCIRVFVKIFTLIAPALLAGQDADVHVSQFFHSPLFLNPALTGSGDIDFRLSAVHRRQWETVPVSYLTFAAAGEARLPLELPNAGFLTAGVSVLHDEAGDGNLSITAVNVLVAGHISLSRFQRISAGLSAGAGQRAVNGSRLQWGSQFDGELYNPGQIAGEPIDQLSRGFADLSGGLNWQLKTPQGLTLDAGAAAFHVNRPAINFLGIDSEQWAIRWSSYAIGIIPLSGPYRIRAHASVQIQGSKREYLTGTGLLVSLGQERGQALVLGAHLGARLGDALIPSVELRYGPWTAGLSFDINTSGFQTATNRSGGPEFVIIHTIRRVKPPAIFESCPIY